MFVDGAVKGQYDSLGVTDGIWMDHVLLSASNEVLQFAVTVEGLSWTTDLTFIFHMNEEWYNPSRSDPTVTTSSLFLAM